MADRREEIGRCPSRPQATPNPDYPKEARALDSKWGNDDRAQAGFAHSVIPSEVLITD